MTFPTDAPVQLDEVPDFSGEVAAFYDRYRRDYPEDLVDELVAACAADGAVAIDIGCGTGQLSVPLARRMATVIALDPSADMLRYARRRAGRAGTANLLPVLADATALPAVAVALGPGTLRLITVGTAIHLMDHRRLFADAARVLPAGGGLAVLANGTPIWMQSTAASRALRSAIEQWFGITLTRTCATSPEELAGLRLAMEDNGFRVTEMARDSTVQLTAEEVFGLVCSALGPEMLPAPGLDRLAFAAHLEAALDGLLPVPDLSTVRVLLGRR
ncbi:methyltransferase domain-containing protein [Nakamurella sp. YIM 132087]|uniref:Methyltransferase domain-containing protein n=1 Tax=Nakamurella alba TaxID=2665158 RepID=A0A7K1FNH4_9ACTN|nr:class I SAM-dependent methyltransferase [Nakamurella alba]MTD15715.1 methyltransferase domain-containing protein [Nakamurella alba]